MQFYKEIIARGGQFMTIPNEYPINAQYTYDDQNFDSSNSQNVEYLYWALISMLGAQENKLEEINNEWKLNTSQKLKILIVPYFLFLLTLPIKCPTFYLTVLIDIK